MHSPTIGDPLPTLETGAITRHAIALYAAGSGDLNPIHVDVDYARNNARLPDVIVHGMFSMGYLGRLVADWAGPAAVREIEVRFESMVPVHESLRCESKIIGLEEIAGGRLVTVSLVALKSDGAAAASGKATLFLLA